ncbi:MAG: hypothetical protein ACRDPC_18345 [Solirubrobacteraceae bacterium]
MAGAGVGGAIAALAATVAFVPLARSASPSRVAAVVATWLFGVAC